MTAPIKAPVVAHKYRMRYHRLYSIGNYENEMIEIEDTFSDTVPDHVALITLKARVLALQQAGHIGKPQHSPDYNFNPGTYPNGPVISVPTPQSGPVSDSANHPF